MSKISKINEELSKFLTEEDDTLSYAVEFAKALENKIPGSKVEIQDGKKVCWVKLFHEYVRSIYLWLSPQKSSHPEDLRMHLYAYTRYPYGEKATSKVFSDLADDESGLISNVVSTITDNTYPKEFTMLLDDCNTDAGISFGVEFIEDLINKIYEEGRNIKKEAEKKEEEKNKKEEDDYILAKQQRKAARSTSNAKSTSKQELIKKLQDSDLSPEKIQSILAAMS